MKDSRRGEGITSALSPIEKNLKIVGLIVHNQTHDWNEEYQRESHSIPMPDVLRLRSYLWSMEDAKARDCGRATTFQGFLAIRRNGDGCYP